MDPNMPRTIAQRFPVTLRWNRKLHEGFTRHLSARGFSVTLAEAIPAGQTLAAWLRDEAIADYPTDGIVQWVRKLPTWTRTGAEWEVGLRFLMWSDPYFRFLERFIREHVERRKFQRYEDELKVVLGSDRRRTEEVTRNVSRGGMLIETKRDLKVGDEVLVGLTIPDLLDQVQVWCQVVQVTADPRVDSFVVSLTIVAFDHDDGATFHRYVEHLNTLYAFDERPETPPFA
jgi:Tfp pilus assembly protein PilZ